MGGFNEQNTVENCIRDRLAGAPSGEPRWKYISGPDMDRTQEDV